MSLHHYLLIRNKILFFISVSKFSRFFFKCVCSNIPFPNFFCHYMVLVLNHEKLYIFANFKFKLILLLLFCYNFNFRIIGFGLFYCKTVCDFCEEILREILIVNIFDLTIGYNKLIILKLRFTSPKPRVSSPKS